MSVNPALAGQNVSQPVREEWLDPTELHPLHQALIDQVSKQRGPRVHRLSPFMERAKAGMDSMTILKDSYDRKTKAVEAQTAMVLDPNLQYAAQGLPTPEEQLAAGMPLGVVAPGAPSGGPVQPARPGDPSGGPLGPAVPTAQTVRSSPLDGQEYGRISAELGGIRRPEYPGEAPLNDPPLEQVIGAAVLGYLTKNPRLATLPLEAQVFDQQRRTKEGLAAYGAESRAAEDRISTLERMLGVQSGRDVDAARRADDAAQFNAREANDWETDRFKQDQITSRQAARAGSQMAQLLIKLDRADNKKGAELASEFRARQEILRTAHRDWTEDQIDEKAAEYVNSRPELTVQQTAKAKVETTYLQRTLNSRIREAESKAVNAKLQGAYLKARTKYTAELTRFLPQAEALKWASLMALMDYRDRSLGLREEENDAGLDDAAVKSARTAAESANEEYEKYKSMLDNRVDGEGNALHVGSGDVDFNTGAVQGDDDTAAKIRRLMYFFKSAAMKAEETLDKATRDAQASQARAQERRKGQSRFRLPQLPGFVPGDKGNKPLDPTGGAFDRPPGEPLKLGGDVNPYSDVV